MLDDIEQALQHDTRPGSVELRDALRLHCGMAGLRRVLHHSTVLADGASPRAQVA